MVYAIESMVLSGVLWILMVQVRAPTFVTLGKPLNSELWFVRTSTPSSHIYCKSIQNVPELGKEEEKSRGKVLPIFAS